MGISPPNSIGSRRIETSSNHNYQRLSLVCLEYIEILSEQKLAVLSHHQKNLHGVPSLTFCLLYIFGSILSPV